MKIYVQSRGYYQPEQDYRWLEVSQDGKINTRIPPLSSTATNLIAQDSPSLVLERLPTNQLLLMITGIEPYKIQESFDSITSQMQPKKIPRQDSEPRQITVDVVWLAEDNEKTDFGFRQMAAFTLKEENQESLAEKIDRAVLFLKDIDTQLSDDIQNNQYGFYPRFEELYQLVFPESFYTIPTGEAPELIKKIGKNVPQMKNELSEEIGRCYLPSDYDILVIVTGSKKRKTLEDAGGWRSLSELVDQDHWEEVQSINQAQKYSEIDLKKLILLPIDLFTTVLETWQDFFQSVFSASKNTNNSESNQKQNLEKLEE